MNKDSAIAGLVFLLLSTLSGCSPSTPLEGLAAGETGRVVRVIDGDSLVLDTGQSVRLVGLEAPSFGRGEEPDQAYADKAKRMLEDLVLGRRVRLYYPGLTRDKYDRALAHAKTIDDRGPKIWINMALVEAGAARVRAYPDTARLTDFLLEAEETARAGEIGLWKLADYRPVKAEMAPTSERGFSLVEGTVAEPVPTDRPGQLCALSLTGSSLRLVADQTAPRLCDIRPGDRLLARGYTTGNRLYITHDSNVQLLD